MALDFGVPGFTLSQHERVGLLVEMVGGPVKAAALTGRTRQHIDNMRKPGASLRIEDLLPLCRESGVSLDWVATGYQLRPDLAGRDDGPVQVRTGGPGEESVSGFVRLMPVRPETAPQGKAIGEHWTPSEVAVSEEWLGARFGLTAETARCARLDDDGMAPRFPRGALVIVDTRPARPRSGIYLLEAGGELLARRLSPRPGSGPELTADADANWRYSVASGAADVPALHRIVWIGQET